MCWETNRKPGLRFAHATARGAINVKVGYATAGGVGGFPSWWYGPVARGREGTALLVEAMAQSEGFGGRSTRQPIVDRPPPCRQLL
jgi:hypothetical protein